MSKREILIVIWTTVFVLVIIMTALLIVVNTESKKSHQPYQTNPIVQNTNYTTQPSQPPTTPQPQPLQTKEEKVILLAGVTYALVTENMEYYVDVVKVGLDKLYASGEAYHLGEKAYSMSFKDYFSRDADNNNLYYDSTRLLNTLMNYLKGLKQFE